MDIARFEKVDLDAEGALNELAREAKRFLMSYQWCWHVFDVYRAAEYGGAVVFVASIKPFVAAVGTQVWVVSGNVPLTYVDTRACETPVEALAVYCVSALIWISKTIKAKATTVAIKPSRHEDFQPLNSEDELRSFIPPLADAMSALISHEVAFATLHAGLQEEVRKTLAVARGWRPSA